MFCSMYYSHRLISLRSHDQTALSTLLKGLGHCVGLGQFDHEMHSSFYTDNMTSSTFLQIVIGANLFNCYKKQISFHQLLWKPQYFSWENIMNRYYAFYLDGENFKIIIVVLLHIINSELVKSPK